MKMVFYADVFLLLNFIMNFMILETMNLIMNLKRLKKRIAAGAFASSCFGFFVLLMAAECGRGVYFLGECVTACSAVFAAFGYCKIRHFLGEVVLFYMLSCFFGGSIYVMKSFIPDAGWMAELMAGTLGMIMTAMIYKEYKCRQIRGYRCTVVLWYNGKSRNFHGLLDSGNTLCSPLTGVPVHIMNLSAARGFVEPIRKITYIPYESIDKKNGVMPGIYMDRMELQWEGKTICIKDPLVAVNSGEISKNGKTEILLNASCITYL